ncbi:MAG: class I SAM-dependent methyltransferase [Nanoarchaeota archaeon]|nr:class I SAM-dependent methyltransferase [Nanoarchaeota archaeon]
MIPINPSADNEQYDVPFILDNMGVDFLIFKGKVLDIGCGIEARLVEHLRKKDIQAEGTDAALEIKRSYLTRAFDYEPIQRPDNHYDLALSHMSNFRQGTNVFRQILFHMLEESHFNLVHAIADKAMLGCIKQTMRVLKPGKELRIFPRPNYLLHTYLGEIESQGIEVRTEKVFDKGIERLDRVHLAFNIIFKSPSKALFEQEFYYRTILTKPR